jgi:NTP pyrophosphatase (non-canonical NTP hydrolase)
MNPLELEEKIIDWAIQRGIDKASPHKQMLKVTEEVGELAGSIAKGNEAETIDAIGDVLVTVLILSYQLELNPWECLESAYNEIKDRKGKNVDGVFVKE